MPEDNLIVVNGFQVSRENLPMVESSNKTAWQRVKDDSNINHHVIIADQQSGGRGRMGRIWESPLGNLYFSLIYKLKDQNLLKIMVFLTSVAINNASRFFLADQKINIENKWPNDLLINGKKVCGILIENKKNKFGNIDCVIGVGVNLISHPQKTIYPAVNFAEFGVNIDKSEFLQKFLEDFYILIEKFQNFGFMPIRNMWLANAFKLGEYINLSLSDKNIEGVFKDIDVDGCLILEDANSKNIKINTADFMLT